MPGDTPHKAYEAFVDPLRVALSCVLSAPVMCTSGGQHELGRIHDLAIGYEKGGDGYLKLKGGRRRIEMRARMQYEVIESEDPSVGKYRVTTRAYSYSVRRQDGTKIVDFHWHPDGNSHEVLPHIHFGGAELRQDAVFSNKDHIIVNRMTFESVIRTLIGQLGVTPLCDNWEERLQLTEGPHLYHRTWH